MGYIPKIIICRRFLILFYTIQHQVIVFIPCGIQKSNSKIKLTSIDLHETCQWFA